MVQMVKRLPAMQETQVRSLGWGDPLEKEMATHSSILAWRIPWTEDLAGYSPRGCKESDTIERLHFHFQTMVEVMKIMVTSFKRSYAHTAPTLQQATANP